MEMVVRCRYCGRLLKKKSSLEARAGETCLKKHQIDTIKQQSAVPEERLNDNLHEGGSSNECAQRMDWCSF